MLTPWKKSYDQPRQHIKKQSYYFADKVPHSQSYGFSSSHVQMWEVDHKEGWVPKNWFFWTVMLKKTLDSPLNCKVIKPVNSKGTQPWRSIGRMDAKAEAPILWPLYAKSWLTGKYPDARKDWRQEEKGTTEDKLVGWHHWWISSMDMSLSKLGVDDGQRSLACCSPWGHKESDTTEQLNWNKLI